MIDLMDKSLWKWDTGAGNLINPGHSWASLMAEDCCEFRGNQVFCYVKKGDFQAYDHDPQTWAVRRHNVRYAVGHMVSKAQYGFGAYKLVCRFPNFRGSWPAFWFVDWLDQSQGGMGMPPEVDVFEQFRKDRFLTRFALSCTYHQGPTYETNVEIAKRVNSWLPWDWKDITFGLLWTTDAIFYTVNGKLVLTIKKGDVKKFPYKAMNVLIGAQVNDWRGRDAIVKPDPFIIKEFTFEPLT